MKEHLLFVIAMIVVIFATIILYPYMDAAQKHATSVQIEHQEAPHLTKIYKIQ